MKAAYLKDINKLVTAIILTLNEEKNIQRCLSALTWANRIVIVDSGSTDKTVEYAEGFGCEVYFNSWSGFAEQRNWALDNTNIDTEWVLFIDADEVVTEKLQEEIVRAVKSDEYNVYYLCFKVMLFGKWVKRSSCFPVWHPRLLRFGKVRYKEAITKHAETWDVEGNVGFIHEPYIHYNFSKGLTDWFRKHNQLSTMECEAFFNLKGGFWPALRGCFQKNRQKARQSLRELSYYLPMRPLIKFIYLFFIRGGIFDGPAGWMYCTLYTAYEIMICAKIAEKRYQMKKTYGDH